MNQVNVFEIIGRRVLVTRASARLVEPYLLDSIEASSGNVILDLSGIEGITPSFLDETLSMCEDVGRKRGAKDLRITVLNAPTSLSSKFKAVARGHALDIYVNDEGSWVISQ